MKTYIVIPAYNEAKRIDGVLTNLKDFNLPIIVVDDGSNDRTLEKSKEHGVIVLGHKVNLGKGAALRTGCQAAFLRGAEVIIMLDSDGQHKASDLPKFLLKIESGKFDVVFGSRNMSLGVPLVRFVGNKIASVLISLLFGVYVSDLICGYRALTKKAYNILDLKSSDYGIETEMVIKCAKFKLRYCEIPVEAIYYDKFKGVTILDAVSVLFSVIKWRTIK